MKEQLFRLMILSLALTSCGRRVAVDGVLPRIDRPTWSAVETTPDHFVVLLKNASGEQEAISELCQQQFVCLGPAAGGRLVIIERKPK